MKRNINRMIAIGTLSVIGASGMGMMSGTAHAKKSTLYKYGAIAGAAATGYGLVKGKGKVATIGAATAAGSYYMYKKSERKEEEKRREQWYRRRYGKNWRHHYVPSR